MDQFANVAGFVVHELRQSVQRHPLRHPVAETVSQVVAGEVLHLREFRVPLHRVCQAPDRDRPGLLPAARVRVAARAAGDRGVGLWGACPDVERYQESRKRLPNSRVERVLELVARFISRLQ